MPRLSTLAVSTLVPALNVLSTTLPDSTFFSVVRTNAPPLPGLTCWNPTTDHSWPSRLSTIPFFRSFVVATGCVPSVQVSGNPYPLRDGPYRTRRSLVVVVSSSGPPGRTTSVSSIRTPPRPSRYTPGSTVTAIRSASVPAPYGPTAGASWISSPTPWPSPWPNCSPRPAASITARAARSTATTSAPAVNASRPARC